MRLCSGHHSVRGSDLSQMTKLSSKGSLIYCTVFKRIMAVNCVMKSFLLCAWNGAVFWDFSRGLLTLELATLIPVVATTMQPCDIHNNMARCRFLPLGRGCHWCTPTCGRMTCPGPLWPPSGSSASLPRSCRSRWGGLGTRSPLCFSPFHCPS